MIETPSAAKFALSCIKRVCQWAIDSGHREKANPASGPKRQIDMPPATHATFLPVCEVAEALAKIDASDSSEAAKLAARFTALTAKRLCEVRRAAWGEIDLDARAWTIPGRRNAKIKEDHAVPLSGAAMCVRRRALGLPQSHGVVFPNPLRRWRHSGRDDPADDVAGRGRGIAARFPVHVSDLGPGAGRELGGVGDQPEPPRRWLRRVELRAVGHAGVAARLDGALRCCNRVLGRVNTGRSSVRVASLRPFDAT